MFGYYSCYFTVFKKDAGLLPVIDLRGNIGYLTKMFWVVILLSIIPLLKKGDWLAMIDLKDAFFHISIRPDYFCFAVGYTVYQLKLLPFGLSIAPGMFASDKED